MECHITCYKSKNAFNQPVAEVNGVRFMKRDKISNIVKATEKKNNCFGVVEIRFQNSHQIVIFLN